MKIDDSSKSQVAKYNWYLSNGYYAAWIGGTQVYLHRLLLNAESDDIVDHIDGDKLNNSLSNLRLCKQEHNCCNKVKTTQLRTSKYKGVSFRKSHSKFQATIMKHGLQTHIGYFNKEEDAARAYNTEAIKVFGEFAKLNDIKETSDEIDRQTAFRNSESFSLRIAKIRKDSAS